VYSIFVLAGRGRYGGVEISGGNPGLDELLVTHERAVRDLDVTNTGGEDLVVVKFFGPDINADCPYLPLYS